MYVSIYFTLPVPVLTVPYLSYTHTHTQCIMMLTSNFSLTVVENVPVELFAMFFTVLRSYSKYRSVILYTNSHMHENEDKHTITQGFI